MSTVEVQDARGKGVLPMFMVNAGFEPANSYVATSAARQPCLWSRTKVAQPWQ